ncbi:hypothetical protein QQ045_022609 [Rhodiola kirilowii]
MADPGQNQPPDPGGYLKEIGASSSSPKTNPAPTSSPPQAAARSFVMVTKTPILSHFPTINLAAREENLRHTLVAKFSLGRPHIEDIHKVFLSAWNLNNKWSIGEARKVLAHPLMKIGHSMFRVFRRSKDFNLKKEPSTTSAWIRLPSLPPEMYNPGYIEPIVTSFGRFLAVDNRTTSFNNPSFARVCVEIDTTSNLPDAVWIATGKESGFWQGIEYENTLLYCSKCKLHGHNLSISRKVKRKNEEEQHIWTSRDDFGLPIGAPNIATPAMTGVPAKTAPAPTAPIKTALHTPAVPTAPLPQIQAINLPT